MYFNNTLYLITKKAISFFYIFWNGILLKYFSFSAVNKNRFVRDLIRIFLSVISIHSLSKEVANWYDTSAAQDLIALDPNTKILKGATATEGWQCLGSVTTTDGSNKTLAELYGLSAKDLVLTGTAPTAEITSNTDVSAKCSAIRLVSDKAEVLLVATTNGKFNTNGKTYGYSKLGEGSQYTTAG